MTKESNAGRRLEAVVLAAGAGSRFGGGKLLSPYRGGKLIHGALTAALAAPVRRIIIVTGHDHEAVGREALALCDDKASDTAVEIIHAADHHLGMAASLKAGVAATSAEAEGVFVFLGDMPDVPLEVAGSLAEAFDDEVAAVAPMVGGRRGHPVLCSRRLFPQLLALEGDVGARRLLDRLGGHLISVEVEDQGVLFDVDYPGDLAR